MLKCTRIHFKHVLVHPNDSIGNLLAFLSVENLCFYHDKHILQNQHKITFCLNCKLKIHITKIRCVKNAKQKTKA